MANLNDILKDPDFWGDQTSDDDRKYVLGKVPEMKDYTKGQFDIFLKNQAKVRQETLKREQEGQQKRQQGAQQLQQKGEAERQTIQTGWQSVVAPLTDMVGRGMESLTKPLVPLARMMKGESNPLEGYAKGDFQGAGGKAAESRQTAAAGVVPQSPWQAGAIGAQFVPGVGAAGAMGRVGGAMLGGGALQGLFGEKGLVEGGGLEGAGREAAGGVLKAGATQAAGEGLGKLVGAARRAPFTGAQKRAGEVDTKNVMSAVREISPELQPGKGMQAAGQYFTGSKAAPEAAGKAFQGELKKIERALNDTQGHPFINSAELQAAWKQLMKAGLKDPVLAGQANAIKPSPQGFLPEQAAKVISLTRQRLGANQTGLGHLKNEAVDELVNSIEQTLPAAAKGILPAAREGYARASGLSELLSPAFKPGKGYQIDMRELQKTLSTDPDFLNRLGKSQLEKLFAAVTRGASKGPGFADIPFGNLNVPYPSTQGALVAALRNLVQMGSTVGRHPLTLSEGAKAGLGVATTAASSVAGRASKKEK